jgi:rhamnulokinase
MPINSLYQLIAHRRHSPEVFDAAETLLMIPDWLHWCLCGAKGVEFTNATTTQLVHPTRRDWSEKLIAAFDLPRRIFPGIIAPGTRLGNLRSEVVARTGLHGVEIIAPATHDTGSAVVGVPTANTGRANWAYISSGTWSLMGVEVPQAVLTQRALELNLTNEGGVDGTYRLLENIMGLWLVQQCKRAFDAGGRAMDYAELVRLAGEAEPLRSFVDPDDARFLAPDDMPRAIQDFCRETGQPVPDTESRLVRCALESLALKYRVVLGWIAEVTGTTVEVIHIVGGGARNALLNQFTADACGVPVLAGPVEATVLGNILMQVRARGELGSLADIRAVVRASGGVSEFQPRDTGRWAEALTRLRG